MRRRRQRLISLALLGGLLGWGWPAMSSAATTYGPSWGRFTAAFPSTPTESGNLLKQLTGVKGAVAGYGFAVTKDKHLFSSSSTGPTVPTYEVVTVQFSSADVASSAIASVRKQLSNPKNVTVGAAKGFKAFGTVAATKKSKGHAATKGYTLGVEFLTKASTGYQVVVETSTSAAATAFVASVRPVS